jgi:hypothetical protein
LCEIRGHDDGNRTRSEEKCAPQLVYNHQLLVPQHYRREAQHEIAAQHQLVVPELVVPPPSRRQMQCAVDLGHDPLTALRSPFGIDVSAASEEITAYRLPDRCRQPVATTQPAEVDLAERLGSLSYVLDGKSHRVPVADTRVGKHGAPQLTGGNELLLDAGSQEATGRARLPESARGEDKRGRRPV